MSYLLPSQDNAGPDTRPNFNWNECRVCGESNSSVTTYNESGKPRCYECGELAEAAAAADDGMACPVRDALVQSATTVGAMVTALKIHLAVCAACGCERKTAAGAAYSFAEVA